jgi:two-component system cell cycle response regulator
MSSSRILVVDDNPANLRLLADWLASESYTVSTATNGFQALAEIEAEEPDIVLLDVMMPGLDGFETCRRIKAVPATVHIPVIMVTALQDTDDLVRGFEAGADDFLTKPINGIALIARVRSQLRRKRHHERILEQSLVDQLTGAFNRRYFDAHAPRRRFGIAGLLDRLAKVANCGLGNRNTRPGQAGTEGASRRGHAIGQFSPLCWRCSMLGMTSRLAAP